MVTSAPSSPYRCLLSSPTKLNSELPFLQAPSPKSFIKHCSFPTLPQPQQLLLFNPCFPLTFPPLSVSPQSPTASPHATEPAVPHRGGRKDSWRKRCQRPGRQGCHAVLSPLPCTPRRSRRTGGGRKEEAAGPADSQGDMAATQHRSSRQKW